MSYQTDRTAEFVSIVTLYMNNFAAQRTMAIKYQAYSIEVYRLCAHFIVLL